MKQVDLFGNEIEYKQKEQPILRQMKQLTRMQQKFGRLPGEKCKNCNGLKGKIVYTRKVFKCKFDRDTFDNRSDIDPEGEACGFFARWK